MERRAKTKRANRRKAAGTQDVVGKGIAAEKIPTKWKQHYGHLLDLRTHMLGRKRKLVEAAREEKPNFSEHMADAGTDNYDRDFALSMVSSEQDALYEIEQALNRIRKGTYGICEMTGKRIEPARLEAIPWTRFSVEAE
jgi:RNA polymerase-binding transcription factor DksA